MSEIVFNIQLPNSRANTYRMVTLLVLAINVLSFGYLYLQTDIERTKSICMTGLVLCFIDTILYLFREYKKTLAGFRIEIGFIFIAILWLILFKYLHALLVLFFAIAGFLVSKKFTVIFTKEYILYPSFPSKKFLWQEVNNAMIKDGMLTIDLKNNRLIQSLMENPSSAITNEEAFNLFCAAQIRKSQQLHTSEEEAEF